MSTVSSSDERYKQFDKVNTYLTLALSLDRSDSYHISVTPRPAVTHARYSLVPKKKEGNLH